MKLQMSPTNRLIAAMLAVAAIAIAFWMMLLSPKRDEAKKLGAEIERLEASLALHEGEVVEAEAAREEFPTQYQRLVVLGKAVPGDDDVASLLVQLNRISDRAEGTFRELQLTPGSGGGEAVPAPAASAEGEPASATEVAASLMPLGATVGPAGLAVMPYQVTFDGSFFDVADFIKGLDSLVKTDDEGVVVDGRLVTIDGFALEADPNAGFPALQANFSLTTFLTPPSEGTTATPTELGAPETATPAATTTGGAP
jgi:Tfp pilus assembly protein PilO